MYRSPSWRTTRHWIISKKRPSAGSTSEYTYLIRASLAGEYRVIPTHAYEMYFPEVFGRSDGEVFTIVDEE